MPTKRRCSVLKIDEEINVQACTDEFFKVCAIADCSVNKEQAEKYVKKLEAQIPRPSFSGPNTLVPFSALCAHADACVDQVTVARYIANVIVRRTLPSSVFQTDSATPPVWPEQLSPVVRSTIEPFQEVSSAAQPPTLVISPAVPFESSPALRESSPDSLSSPSLRSFSSPPKQQPPNPTALLTIADGCPHVVTSSQNDDDDPDQFTIKFREVFHRMISQYQRDASKVAVPTNDTPPENPLMSTPSDAATTTATAKQRPAPSSLPAPKRLCASC